MNDLNTTPKTPRWQKKKILNAIVISLLVVIALIAAGYTFQWDWTGLTSSYKITTTTEIMKTPERKEITTLEDQPAKTLWDWLQLLGILAIPIVVVVGIEVFTTRQ